MEYILSNSNHILRSAGRVLYKASNSENNFNNYTLQLKNKNSEREKNDRIIYDQHKRINNNKKILKYLLDKNITNKRLSFIEKKFNINNKNKYSCMKVSIIIALIMLIIPILGFIKIIKGKLIIILYVIGLFIIIIYNLLLNLNYDKKEMTIILYENNFNKPEEEILKSKLNYEKEKMKYSNIQLSEDEIYNDRYKNINLNINNYINTEKCNIKIIY